MILRPAVPSDQTPQVVVTTSEGNITFSAWMDPRKAHYVDRLRPQLRAVAGNRSLWRVRAVMGVRDKRFKKNGIGTGTNLDGCFVTMTIRGKGTTIEEFNVAYNTFVTEVLKVAMS